MHILVLRGWKIFANEIGFDRQFTVTAVHKHGKLNAFWPAEVIQCIHGRSGGAPAIEDIIDKDDHLSIHIKRDQSGLDVWCHALVKIIPMHADVQSATTNRVAPNAGQNLTKSPR